MKDHNTDNTPINDENLKEFIELFCGTEEFRALVRAFAPAMTRQWAGKAVLKRGISQSVEKSIQKAFKRSPEDQTLSTLLQQPETAATLALAVPRLLQYSTALLSDFLREVAQLDSEKKAEIHTAVVQSLDGRRLGAIMNSLTDLLKNDDPDLFADRLEDTIRSFIDEVDFGEIREFLDQFSQQLVSLTGKSSEIIWQYPAKMVTLLSLIPLAINTWADIIAVIIRPLNRLAPDLVADVILSLFRDIRADKAASLANELLELAHRFQTGSVLLGSTDTSKLQSDVQTFMAAFMQHIDITLLEKARAGFKNMQEALSDELLKSRAHHPRLMKGELHSQFQQVAFANRRLRANLDAFRDTFDDEELAELIAEYFSEIDPQLLADTCNDMAEIISDLLDNNPAITADFIKQFAGSLDHSLFGEIIRQILPDIFDALHSLAPEIMPACIHGTAGLIRKAREKNPDAMDRALKDLKSALQGEENHE